MKQKPLTIITSETELIERIYIVTPTTTGSPEKGKRGTSQSQCLTKGNGLVSGKKYIVFFHMGGRGPTKV